MSSIRPISSSASTRFWTWDMPHDDQEISVEELQKIAAEITEECERHGLSVRIRIECVPKKVRDFFDENTLPLNEIKAPAGPQ